MQARYTLLQRVRVLRDNIPLRAEFAPFDPTHLSTLVSTLALGASLCYAPLPYARVVRPTQLTAVPGAVRVCVCVFDVVHTSRSCLVVDTASVRSRRQTTYVRALCHDACAHDDARTLSHVSQ
jgi:hypothetical protein